MTKFGSGRRIAALNPRAFVGLVKKETLACFGWNFPVLPALAISRCSRFPGMTGSRSSMSADLPCYSRKKRHAASRAISIRLLRAERLKRAKRETSKPAGGPCAATVAALVRQEPVPVKRAVTEKARARGPLLRARRQVHERHRGNLPRGHRLVRRLPADVALRGAARRSVRRQALAARDRVLAGHPRADSPVHDNPRERKQRAALVQPRRHRNAPAHVRGVPLPRAAVRTAAQHET